MRRHPEGTRLELIIGLLLVFLLASSVVLTSGCANKTSKTSEVEVGPLESPFSEIIPNCEDLYCDLFFRSYKAEEETIYYPDGVIGYYRAIGNSSCFHYGGENRSGSVLLNMVIREYQDEEQAIKRIHEEKESRLYDESDSEFYAKHFNLPLEDIAGHVIFWKEAAADKIQGEEVISFRVGHYVGDYRIWIYDPPKLGDGYFMPPTVSDLLENAVQITIPGLSPEHMGVLNSPLKQSMVRPRSLSWIPGCLLPALG